MQVNIHKAKTQLSHLIQCGPFDRLLIAQNVCEKLVLLSVGKHFADYEIDLIWKH